MMNPMGFGRLNAGTGGSLGPVRSGVYNENQGQGSGGSMPFSRGLGKTPDPNNDAGGGSSLRLPMPSGPVMGPGRAGTGLRGPGPILSRGPMAGGFSRL